MSLQIKRGSEPPELNLLPGEPYFDALKKHLYIGTGTENIIYKTGEQQQILTVAKKGGDYTSIQSAINAISDASANKIYTVLVYPGEYDEAITLGNYIDIVAINPENTKILQQVTDNYVERHCYLKITIESSVNRGLHVGHSNSVITIDGNISSSVTGAVKNENGSITINGNILSSTDYGVYSENGSVTVNGDVSSSAESAIIVDEGYFTLINGTIKSTFNNSAGHGIYMGPVTLILQNAKIVCTHADAKSIYSGAAKDIRCMSVWANRDLDVNVTNLITGGFTYDNDVQ